MVEDDQELYSDLVAIREFRRSLIFTMSETLLKKLKINIDEEKIEEVKQKKEKEEKKV